MDLGLSPGTLGALGTVFGATSIGGAGAPEASDETWAGADPIGVQSGYILQVLDETDAPVPASEFCGRKSHFQFALPPQALMIQRSLRAEVLRDITSGAAIVSGGEGIGRITIQGTHGVGPSRDFSQASDGRNLRDGLTAFFEAWVQANDERGRAGKAQLRMVFQMIGGNWSNPENEQYWVWPEAFPTDSRSASRPHAWDWAVTLHVLGPRSLRAPTDPQKAISPTEAAAKLKESESLLDRLTDVYKLGKAKVERLRELRSTLAKVRDRVVAFRDGTKDAIYSVTDLVRGASQISSEILGAMSVTDLRDDTVIAVRGALYDVRRTLGAVALTAQQFERSGAVQAALSSPRTASLSRPVSVAVSPGDTLQGIAARHLGDSSRWTELVAINKLEYPFFDFGGTNGAPGAAFAGRRVLGKADTLKLPLPVTSAVVGVSSDPIGTDLSDLESSGAFMVGGKDNMAAALLRRMRTPRGRIPWHPLYGSGLHALIGSAQTYDSAALVRREATLTASSDPRVLSVRSVAVAVKDQAIGVEFEAITPMGPVSVAGPLS